MNHRRPVNSPLRFFGSAVCFARGRSAWLLTVLLVLFWGAPQPLSSADAAQGMPPGFARSFALTFQTLSPLSISASTGQKPQSKVWTYNSKWWMVVPSSSGTAGSKLWRLDGLAWTEVLHLHTSTEAEADVVTDGDLAHVLLFDPSAFKIYIISLQFNTGTGDYELWSVRPTTITLSVNSSVETATMAIDSNGRLWIAYEEDRSIKVRYSDSPYSTWNGPEIINATSVNKDDICDIVAFDGNKIGVFWSDQNSEKFLFRYHNDGDSPTTWQPIETAWTGSGSNISDDHISLAAESNGRIYAAVKTGGDDLGLLVRQSTGTWDATMYVFDNGGTRPIVVLNEIEQNIYVFYNASNGYNDIVYRVSPISAIGFGSEQVLIGGETVRDVSTIRDRFTAEVVLIASTDPASQPNTLHGRLGISDLGLPVELAFFQATAGDGEVILQWRTESEVANQGFLLERALQPSGPFELIASYRFHPELVGQGNANHATDYEYVDRQVQNGITYYYRLADVDFNGQVTYHAVASATPESQTVAEQFALLPNYPNPFNPETTIPVQIPASGAQGQAVQLIVYNSLGQPVRVLHRGSLSAGYHEFRWDGFDQNGQPVPSGVYFVRLQSEQQALTRKMVLQR